MASKNKGRDKPSVETSEDFDPSQLIEKASKNLDPSVLDDLNELDIPKAKNIFQFTTSRKFCFTGDHPFPMQMKVMLDLFEDFCPCCSDMKFWHNIKVDTPLSEFENRLVFLKFGKCKKCGQTRQDFVDQGHFNFKNELACCVGMRGGKCITGPSLTITNHGLLKMSEICDGLEPGFHPESQGLEVHGIHGREPSHARYVSKKSRTRVVRTKTGYYLGGTNEHPIVVLDGKTGKLDYKRLDRIRPGRDVAIIQYGQNLWGSETAINFVPERVKRERNDKGRFNAQAVVLEARMVGENAAEITLPNQLTKALARILGYLTAEGTCTGLASQAFTNHDGFINRDMASCLRRTFGKLNVKVTEVGVDWASVVVGAFFNHLGIIGKYSPQKEVPRIIRQAPKEYVVEFLRSLFEGDGWPEAKRGRVFYASSSKLLTTQVRMLLLNLGITSRVRRRIHSYESSATCSGNTKGGIPGGISVSYELCLSGREVLLFKQNIGFISPTKQTELKKACALARIGLKDTRKARNCELIPGSTALIKRAVHLIQSEIRQSFKERQASYSKIAGEKARSIIKNVVLYEQTPTIAVVKAILGIMNGKYHALFLGNPTLAKLRDQLTHLVNGQWFFDPIVAIKVGKKRKVYDLTVNGTHSFFANGFISHNTAMVGWVAAYQLHRFLHMKNPAQMYGLRKGSTLQMTFSAITAGQAQDTLWDSFTSVVDNAPWFEEFHKFLESEGKRTGAQLLNYSGTKLVYLHKKLYIGFTGAEYKKMKGRTRFLTSIDEMGFFDADNKGKVQANAVEVFTALEKSLRTVRSKAYNMRKQGHYDIPTGLMVNVSSPDNIDDAIMKRVREADVNKKVCAYHLATWEFNPGQSIEALKEEAGNSTTFDRDYGAIPPLASDPFINDKEQLDKVFCHENPMLFQLEPKEKVLQFAGVDQDYFWDELKVPFDELTVPRCVSVDTGESNNSFAVAITHYDNIDDKIVVDQLMELRPSKKRHVFFPGVMDEFFLPFAEHFWVKWFVFDHWNSIEFSQTIASHGLPVEAYALKYDELCDVRKQIMADYIMFPKTEHVLVKTKTSEIREVFMKDPVGHLKLQLATVRDVGRKVVKPTNGTDDLWRAVALGANCITRYKEDFADYQAGVMPMFRPTGGRKHGGLAFSLKKPGGGGTSSRGGGVVGTAKPNMQRLVRVHKGSFGLTGGGGNGIVRSGRR